LQLEQRRNLHITFGNCNIIAIAIPFIADKRQEVCSMIELTRLNGSRLCINCDLIKYAESAPDTVLTLVTGEKLVVLEPRTEVLRRTLDYRASILRSAWPEAASALAASSAHFVSAGIAAKEDTSSNL
jgi:flagellar protein FlbD